MGYSSGMLNKRIEIARRADEQVDDGGQSGTLYTLLGCFWASEDFNRGTKSLREGAYDAYDTVMFRMRYNDAIDRWCIIRYQNRWYQIQSFNASKHDDQIQITALEMASQDINLI